MLELIAQGKTAAQRWRKVLFQNLPFKIGRTSPDWSVPWDEKISRTHARLRLVENNLTVEKMESARNPIFYQGCEEESFVISPGEHFVIGETTFLLTDDAAMATMQLPSPISQRAFSTEYLRQVRYQDADHRIAVLNRLPEIISASNDTAELHGQMVNLLLAGITSATVVGICRQSEFHETDVVAWDKRELAAGDFNPCARLIAQAIDGRESILHIWRNTEVGSDLTVDQFNDWAFVCPLAGPASRGWALYVAGMHRTPDELGTDETALHGDVKFAELVGATLANLRRVKQLEERQSTFRPFFSPIVMEAFVDQEPDEVLRPRQCEISVLFCDLRGFSAKSEEMSDQLEELLDRVSQALGIMTKAVLDFGGVIGDFHGDSAMGFWGWPLERGHAVENTCLAALRIHEELKAIALSPEHQLHDFQMGIGLATGNAVAGKIGTSHQVKVTAFGPVVNLAARLEGMTRQLNVPLLVDQYTFERAQNSESFNKQQFGFRHLGAFRPYGLNMATNLYQLYPSVEKPDVEVSRTYANALDHFKNRNWQHAESLLSTIAEQDFPAAFLLDYIRTGKGQTDPDFDGVIDSRSK